MAVPEGARLLREGNSLPGLESGTRLLDGDRLQNPGPGDLDARIGDLALVRLKPGSSLRLDLLLKPVEGDPDETETRLRLESGALLVRLRALRGRTRFLVETPGAVLVREAGGVVNEIDGGDFLKTGAVVAANTSLIGPLTQTVRGG